MCCPPIADPDCNLAMEVDEAVARSDAAFAEFDSIATPLQTTYFRDALGYASADDPMDGFAATARSGDPFPEGVDLDDALEFSTGLLDDLATARTAVLATLEGT